MGICCPTARDQSAMSLDDQDISVAEFLSVIVFLAEKSGDIIREVEASGEKQVSMKDKEGPVTIADIRAQKTIMHNLKALYPNLVVKGEESDASTDKVESAVKPEDLTAQVRNFVDSQQLVKMQVSRADFIKKFHDDGVYTEDEISSAPFETFSTKDAVVWIDPLDGTSDYCRGNVGAVTVLIGLTIKDKSRAGVVHMPFSALPDKSQGRTLYGTGEHGMWSVNYTAGMKTEDMVVREAEYLAPFDNFVEEDHEVRVAVSSNRPAPKELMDSIAPSVGIGLGGCGNKCKALLLDEADAYITTGLSYWDVCACEPLVRARGGYITLGNGDKLSYPLGQHHVDGLNASKTIAVRDLMEARKNGNEPECE